MDGSAASKLGTQTPYTARGAETAPPPCGESPPTRTQSVHADGISPAVEIVYIVDDDAAVREAFAKLFRSAGMEPRPFPTAAAFLAEVEESPDACVLLDITMPAMDGMEVQRALRDRRIGIPVITVSAQDDPVTRDQAHRLGALMFLRKPVDDQALLDAVHWAIRPARGA